MARRIQHDIEFDRTPGLEPRARFAAHRARRTVLSAAWAGSSSIFSRRASEATRIEFDASSPASPDSPRAPTSSRQPCGVNDAGSTRTSVRSMRSVARASLPPDLRPRAALAGATVTVPAAAWMRNCGSAAPTPLRIGRKREHPKNGHLQSEPRLGNKRKITPSSQTDLVVELNVLGSKAFREPPAGRREVGIGVGRYREPPVAPRCDAMC